MSESRPCEHGYVYGCPDCWPHLNKRPAMIPPAEARPMKEPPSHIVQLAVEASLCSPCRSKRGAAIFYGNDLIQCGHNYKPGARACDGSVTCKATCRADAVHAEQNALLAAGSRSYRAELLHAKTVDGALVASGGPSCVQCSKLILAAGISAVWLYEADGWQRYDAEAFHLLSLAAVQNPALLRLREALEAWQQVTRIEVIDENGRQFTRWNCQVETSVQDDGRTLKLFLTPGPSAVVRGIPQEQE